MSFFQNGNFAILSAMDQNSLLTWYNKEKRDLPFRKNRDPYQIWISEIMSQQTRIEAMLDHYERFIGRYPTLTDLAGADEDELLKLWQGLGYYSRARNLKKAAQVCVEQYDGHLPATKAELKKLPGIGDYTAGAIASIACGQRVTAIDGNVIRVCSRYYWLENDFNQPKEKKKLEALLLEILPASEQMPDFTQALMELGARVCQPKTARCDICPLKSTCKGALHDHPEKLPVARKVVEKKSEDKQVIIWMARHEGQWMIRVHKRPAKGLLAGLYEFDDHLPETVLDTFPLGEYSHTFTHRIWNMKGTLVITEYDASFMPMIQCETEAAVPSAFMPFYEKAQEIIQNLAEK